MKMAARLEYSCEAILGEGPVWDPVEKRLFWIDIEGQKLYCYDPVEKINKTWTLPQKVGAVFLTKSACLLLALKDGLYLFDTKSNSLEHYRESPEKDIPTNRFNDGKIDRQGRLWIGTMNMDGLKNKGGFYRFISKTVQKKLSKISISNGLAWDYKRGLFYYIDTPTKSIKVFDWDDQAGEISNARVLVDGSGEVGFFDGMTIDTEGKLWVAHWGGFKVSCWRLDANSKAIKVAEISLPVPFVSSCEFGGLDMQTLYITTAGRHITDTAEKYPVTGSLFSCRPGATGFPSFRFNL